MIDFHTHVLPGVDHGSSSIKTSLSQLDLAAAYGIDCIVKGVRDGVDLDYEQDMAHLNRIAGGPETLFLPTDPVYSFIASSAVREFLLRGLPAEKLLPDAVADEVLAAYAEMKK